MPYPTYPSVNVPEVPTARLEYYLDFWESERAAARSLQEPSWERTPYHAEWDINVRVPTPYFFRPPGRDFLSFAGVQVTSPELRAWSAGSGLAVVGQPIGQDPTTIVNLQRGVMYVTPTWAQRAVNAFLAPLGATLVDVDGVIGTQTLGALRFATLRWYANQSHTAVEPDTGQTTVAGIPMPARSGSSLALAREFGDYLAGLTQVADPTPRARPPSAPDTTPATPPADPTQPPTAPSSSGGGLLFLGAAVLGLALYARSR